MFLVALMVREQRIDVFGPDRLDRQPCRRHRDGRKAGYLAHGITERRTGWLAHRPARAFGHPRARLDVAQRFADDLPDLASVRFVEAARRDRRRTDANAARDHGLLRVEGDRVLVHRDAISSRYVSTALPVRFFGLKSTSSKWVSVPPATKRTPAAAVLRPSLSR